MTFNFEKYFFGKTQRNEFSDNDSCRMAAFFVQWGKVPNATPAKVK